MRKQLLEQATETYAQNLDSAASYLLGRGLTKATAESLKLGVVVDPQPGDELVVGRLSIPYLTRNGVVDIKFRCLQHDDCKQYDCIKYLCPTGGGSSRLYNVNAFFTDSDVIGITEGEFDAAILHYEVGIPAVGCPGAQRWERHFSRCFSGYSKVLIFSDGDSTGREFTKRVASELSQSVVINLPLGEDVNSLFLSEGPDGLRSRSGL